MNTTATTEGTVAPPSRAKTRPRSLNPTRFLNRAACREYMLHHAGLTRAHKFTRVSPSTLSWLNSRVRDAMHDRVQRMPSMGRTL